jgi:hypothetical protein
MTRSIDQKNLKRAVVVRSLKNAGVIFDAEMTWFIDQKKLKRAVIVSGVSGGQAGAETQSNEPVELPVTSIPFSLRHWR